MFFDNKIAVFDMDGTIVDTVGFWRKSPERYLNSINKSVSKEDKDFFKYYVLRDSIPRMIEHYDLKIEEDELFKKLEIDVKKGYRKVKTFKGDADIFLNHLKSKGIPTVLYTANEREYLEIINENLNLDKYFDYMFTTSELEATKDSPIGFEKIAKLYNKSISDIVLFEDSYYAIHSASKFGMQSVAISDIHSENLLEEIKKECSFFISSYLELIDF